MSIDDKLGPISRRLGPIGRAYWHIDEEVHRYYEKIVKRWEQDGHERETLAIGAGITSLMMQFTHNALSKGIFTSDVAEAMHTPIGVYTGVGAGVVLWGIALEIPPDGTRHNGETRIIKHREIYRLWRFLRGPRLATLIGGCATLVVGGVHIAAGLRDLDTNAVAEGAYWTTLGIHGISQSSMLYLADEEPALLDRAPAWKRALDAVKNAIAPAPVPIPVQNYSTTEVDA